jgi:hypothetical protein
MPHLVKPYLFLSAAVLLLVGALLSFAPEVLYASSGQDLPAAVMIRSDLRAGGMLLLLSGLFVGAATLNPRAPRCSFRPWCISVTGWGGSQASPLTALPTRRWWRLRGSNGFWALQPWPFCGAASPRTQNHVSRQRERPIRAPE